MANFLARKCLYTYALRIRAKLCFCMKVLSKSPNKGTGTVIMTGFSNVLKSLEAKSFQAYQVLSLQYLKKCLLTAISLSLPDYLNFSIVLKNATSLLFGDLVAQHSNPDLELRIEHFRTLASLHNLSNPSVWTESLGSSQ